MESRTVYLLLDLLFFVNFLDHFDRLRQFLGGFCFDFQTDLRDG